MLKYVLLAALLLVVLAAAYTVRCLKNGRRGRAVVTVLACLAVLALGYLALGAFITSM